MEHDDINAKLKSLGLRTTHAAQYSSFDGVMGVFLIVSACFCGSVYFYAAILSKFLPHTGNVYLDAVKDDDYYCYLIPLSIIPTYIIVYLNWACMKLYESN
jgi:hypothetical protein